MVAGGLVEEPRTVLDATALGVVGTEDEPADAGERDRRRAHRTGFEGDVEIATREPGRTDAVRRGADGQHLGVRCRIARLLDPVAGGGEHRARRGIDDHRADGHLAAPGGGLGFGQRGTDERVLGHPRTMSVPVTRIKRWPAQAGPPRLPGMAKPLIGITVDSEDGGGYSAFPWLALRCNYGSAVVRAGGVPVMLPHEPERVDDYADTLDGLLVSGGDFDVDPALFGATDRHPKVATKDGRTAFEAAMVRAALAADKPVLGICGGQQLLHVVLGGTLIQHIPDEVENALAHEQPNPRDEPGHTVAIVAGTRLAEIVGVGEMAVNSAHHQAARDVPEGVVVNARAPDGVIEGIEAPARRFCLGVQWHPEFELSDGDRRIFDAFVAAARRR